MTGLRRRWVAPVRRELFELFADFVRSSEDAELIGASRVVVHVAEPVLDLRSGDLASLVHRQEDSLGDRERAGSRPASSSAERSSGTAFANDATLDPPAPIHPSANAAARRMAAG